MSVRPQGGEQGDSGEERCDDALRNLFATTRFLEMNRSTICSSVTGTDSSDGQYLVVAHQRQCEGVIPKSARLYCVHDFAGGILSRCSYVHAQVI